MMTNIQLDKDFYLIVTPTILSNIIALPYDKRETLISFLSGVEILIPHKGLVVAQQTFMSSKV